jgi:hypothetical protein
LFNQNRYEAKELLSNLSTANHNLFDLNGFKEKEEQSTHNKYSSIDSYSFIVGTSPETTRTAEINVMMAKIIKPIKEIADKEKLLDSIKDMLSNFKTEE